VEAREALHTHVLSFSHATYYANKVMVIKYAGGTNSCMASRKYSIFWGWCAVMGERKGIITRCKFHRKAFCGPKIDYCKEVAK